MDPRIVRDLTRLLGPEAVLAAPDECLVYECDMLTHYKGAPDVVAFPTTTEQVAAVVRLCLAEGLPVIPRGSGTGLIGGAMAPRGGVLLALNRMNRLLEVDLPNRLAVVEPGLINLWLTRAVEGRGYLFAPDPSSQMVSTIGGNAATNAGGAHCLKYGITVNHVLGLEVVTGEGEVVWLGGKVQERIGYDLTGVMVGSEGTMGVITKLVVRLLHAAEAVETALATFPEIEEAAAAVSAIIARGIVPAALELMDEPILRAVEAGIKAGYPADAKAVLLVELDGPRAEVEAQAEAVAAICRAHGALSLRVARDEAERALLWKGRKEAAGAFGRITHNYVLQDAVVPRSRLAQIMREIGVIAARHGLLVANVFHAGDGNLHPLICYDERVPGGFERALEASEAILRACIAMGGTVTGEHGVGMDKASSLPLLFSAGDLEAMARVRRVFDPRGLMNPAKIFPAAGACREVGQGGGRPVPEGLWV